MKRDQHRSRVRRAAKAAKSEEGSILLTFAAAMVVLCFFIGIALDISLIYMDRNSMQNIAQIMREERFTFQDTVRYADNPAQTAYELVYESAVANGFDGTVKFYFLEEEPQSNYRSYKMRIVLQDQSPYHFGRIFGLETIGLEVTLDGGESYGEGASDVVWCSPLPVDSYNGSYTSTGAGAVVYDSTDLPEDW